jgi:predicted transcriptional regulator/transcriptional regulator with XRE-family HTH domain
MPRTALTGTRIRALRTARRLAQADLARLAGVSASYLNLIEHNRRRAGPRLLAAIAAALEIAPEVLAEDDGEALLNALRAAAAAHDGSAGSERPELDGIEDFAGRFPGWAGLVAQLHARVQDQDRAIERLADRMAHDPNLAAALAEIVSAVTAVQSTAAILADEDDLEPEWQRRFHANIHADSLRLADAAEALVAWLDASGQETGLAAPAEEVESWLARRGWHLPEAEPDAAPGGAGPDWAALVAGQPDLASQAGRRLAEGWARRAQDEARLLPAATLAPALAAQMAGGAGLDPGALARAFGVGPGLVLRRLAALPAAPGLPRLGLVLCDGSGTLTHRRPLDGFALPRFGGGCPLWPLYAALQQPGRPIRAHLETATRPARRFLAFAVAEPREPARFGAAMAWEAVMLLTPAIPAALGPAEPGPPQVVGASCRVCPQADCPARREPSIVTG